VASVVEVARSGQVDCERRARDRYAGMPKRVSERCGRLEIFYDPLEFYVDGGRVFLTPLEGAILELLVRRGRASSQAMLELFEREGASIAALNVHLHRLRRKVLEAGLTNPIETVRGWGLILRIERI
jgi:DNA-binding response OmpR family regulator